MPYRSSEGSGEETGGTGPDENEMDNRRFFHAFDIRKQGTSYFPPVLASSSFFFCKQLRRKASGQTEIDGWPSLSSSSSSLSLYLSFCAMMTLSGKEERSGIKPHYFTLLAKRKKRTLEPTTSASLCLQQSPLYRISHSSLWYICMPFGSFPCVSTAR